MITEWLMDFGLTIFGWLMQFAPRMSEEEGVIITATNALTTMIAGMSSLGVWIPWTTISLCLGITISAYLSMFFLKLVRVIAAHFPLIGGAG